mmetsp:Transcript_82808/g.130990  ORF Transcript_82808/g.130990 Transcript_82808/m.130990 type:complete len:140 (+) Transcript_82808:332-751(+)
MDSGATGVNGQAVLYHAVEELRFEGGGWKSWQTIVAASHLVRIPKSATVTLESLAPGPLTANSLSGNHGAHVLGLVMGFDTVPEWSKPMGEELAPGARVAFEKQLPAIQQNKKLHQRGVVLGQPKTAFLASGRPGRSAV